MGNFRISLQPFHSCFSSHDLVSGFAFFLERGWWKDSREKEKDNDRASGKGTAYNSQQRNEMPQAVRDDSHRDESSKLEDSSVLADTKP